jgi:hypothetical protein
MLPKEAIEEFKKMYKKRFGVELTDAEASFRANNLVNLYKVVFGKNHSDSKKPRHQVKDRWN